MYENAHFAAFTSISKQAVQNHYAMSKSGAGWMKHCGSFTQEICYNFRTNSKVKRFQRQFDKDWFYLHDITKKITQHNWETRWKYFTIWVQISISIEFSKVWYILMTEKVNEVRCYFCNFEKSSWYLFSHRHAFSFRIRAVFVLGCILLLFQLFKKPVGWSRWKTIPFIFPTLGVVL